MTTVGERLTSQATKISTMFTGLKVLGSSFCTPGSMPIRAQLVMTEIRPITSNAGWKGEDKYKMVGVQEEVCYRDFWHSFFPLKSIT